MPIIDASVYVSLANGTDGHHDRCMAWYESSLLDATLLAAPSLLLVEVAAAIRRLTGSSRLARRVISELQDTAPVELYPLNTMRSQAAANVAAKTGVRGADAVYLALAIELQEPLITLDRQQLERGKKVALVKKPA